MASELTFVELPCWICGKPALFPDPEHWHSNPCVPLCSKACKAERKEHVRVMWAAYGAQKLVEIGLDSGKNAPV